MNLSNQYDVMSYNLQTVNHALIADMYLKREYSATKPFECDDVLVIKTNFSDKGKNQESYTTLMSELFLALPSIRDQVEHNVGFIDRIDIKTH